MDGEELAVPIERAEQSRFEYGAVSLPFCLLGCRVGEREHEEKLVEVIFNLSQSAFFVFNFHIKLN